MRLQNGAKMCCDLDKRRVLTTLALQANVAQLVEQLIRNQQVRGSNPLVGSIKTLKIPLAYKCWRYFIFGQNYLL